MSWTPSSARVGAPSTSWWSASTTNGSTGWRNSSCAGWANASTVMEASAMTETRTEWTVEDVAARFAEAAETAHKLPRVRPGAYFNPWMTLASHVPERYPDPERLYRPMPPSPQAVERLLEALRAVPLPGVEPRHRAWRGPNP